MTNIDTIKKQPKPSSTSDGVMGIITPAEPILTSESTIAISVTTGT